MSRLVVPSAASGLRERSGGAVRWRDASGCVAVHGEREVVPSATKAEAAKALKEFTAAYNKADKAYDRPWTRAVVTGALGRHRPGRAEGAQRQQPERQPEHTCRWS